MDQFEISAKMSNVRPFGSGRQVHSAICRLHTTVGVILSFHRQSADCPRNLESADCTTPSAECANPHTEQNKAFCVTKEKIRLWPEMTTTIENSEGQ